MKRFETLIEWALFLCALLSIGTTLAVALIAAGKGKLWSAALGMFIPLIGIVAAIRVARPRSPWARRFYDPVGKKMRKATERDARHDRRWKRIQDVIGGAPSLPSPRDGGKRGD